MIDFNLNEICNIQILVENEIKRLKNMTIAKYNENEIKRYEKILEKINKIYDHLDN